MAYLMLIFTIFANAFANIFVKIGVAKIPAITAKNFLQSIPKILTNPFILLGVFLLIISFPAFSFVLQKMNLSVAYPALVVGAIVVVAIFSFFFFKENIGLAQFFGLVLILAGIWMLFRK
jgi:multidrug transporter EmrE-like cation transporter